MNMNSFANLSSVGGSYIWHGWKPQTYKFNNLVIVIILVYQAAEQSMIAAVLEVKSSKILE